MLLIAFTLTSCTFLLKHPEVIQEEEAIFEEFIEDTLQLPPQPHSLPSQTTVIPIEPFARPIQK